MEGLTNEQAIANLWNLLSKFVVCRKMGIVCYSFDSIWFDSQSFSNSFETHQTHSFYSLLWQTQNRSAGCLLPSLIVIGLVNQKFPLRCSFLAIKQPTWFSTSVSKRIFRPVIEHSLKSYTPYLPLKLKNPDKKKANVLIVNWLEMEWNWNVFLRWVPFESLSVEETD